MYLSMRLLEEFCESSDPSVEFFCEAFHGFPLSSGWKCSSTLATLFVLGSISGTRVRDTFGQWLRDWPEIFSQGYGNTNSLTQTSGNRRDSAAVDRRWGDNHDDGAPFHGEG